MRDYSIIIKILNKISEHDKYNAPILRDINDQLFLAVKLETSAPIEASVVASCLKTGKCSLTNDNLYKY